MSVELPGRVAGFTTRDSGFSDPPYNSCNVGFHVGDNPDHVRANRQLLTDEYGPISWMNQVHGTHIVNASQDGATADAMIVGPGQTAAVMVADCAPVLLISHNGQIGAVVHAGRPGLFAGIVPKTVKHLRRLGATGLRAVIGPTICGSCYEVPEDMARQGGAAACRTRWGSPGIDIRCGLHHQLADLDVAVQDVDICTMEDSRFYSHRGSAGRTGRFAGILGIGDTPAQFTEKSSSVPYREGGMPKEGDRRGNV